MTATTTLPNLTGYLKLPGPFPVARIELTYVKRPKIAPRFVPVQKTHAAGPDAPAPESPDQHADAQDAFELEPPNLELDAQDEPEPAMKNVAAESAVAPEVQGELALENEETGNVTGDGKPVVSGEGTKIAPGTEATDGPSGPQAEAGAGVAENGEAAPESEATKSAQPKGRKKLGWTPI